MHLKTATVGSLKSISSENFDDRTLRQEEQRANMAATTRNNANDEHPQGGGSGTRANNSNNNNNNNNDDSSSNKQQVVDDAELKLKRQTLEQRKQELEMVLSEKNWLLQQIQKQETQILNGNYEYLNVNEIFAMLARQYKKEHGGGGGSDIGSTAVLRRKTIGGSSCKENQVTHNNNNNSTNRQSEISNRSSEYDNYPGSSLNNGECNTTGTSQMQLTKSQSLRKRGTTTPTAQTLGGNYNYLQVQQRQHQQQLIQHQMLQNQMQYAAMMQHPHYHHQQQQLHQHQTHDEQQILHQQQQQQQYSQQISPSQSHLRQYPVDAVSLYSLNSTSVATLRQPHISPQQQPIVVQCDRYYLSPTHQSYNDGGFIKSSQNIKKYVSPQASPTHHGVAATQMLPHLQQTHCYQQELLIATAATNEQKYLLQQQQHQPQQQQQQFLTLQQLQPHNLLHAHTQQHLSSRQLDAISLAPSYISVDVDTAAAHNLRWRSQSNLPPVSPHTPPHKGIAFNATQIAVDTKSHSSDMLSSNAYYNTSAALPAASIKSLTKPLDEISISSFNSETQKSKPPKPKQWLESSLDGPVVRQSPAISNTHGQDTFHNTSSSARLPANKMHVIPAGAGVVSAVVGATRERTKLSSQSMSGAPRHYSMSAASHKHPYAQTKMLQDDDGRYAKLSQSTSYLNSRESPSISAAYPLDGSTNSTTIELPTPTTAFKYLPPKSGTAASTPAQLTPPPPPRPPPMGEKMIAVSSGATIAGIATAPSALASTDIRIESPKNITVVKPATFRPYQEETKPFEMSDFYKYSTKFRQKESSAANAEH